MDMKSLLNQLSQLSEATKETPTGRVHKAEPGGYGRKFDTDEEDDEKKKEEPAVKRGRGRPKKGADSETGEVKKYSGAKDLQSWIIGNVPKKSKELEKLPTIKHRLKEWIQMVEKGELNEAGVPGQQLTMKPMPGAAQLQDPATGKVVATGPADKIKALQGSVAKGEVTMTGSKEEMSEDDTDYSAKKARAGKDIGKPGKQFGKIAKSAAQRYGSKEKGEKVAGAVLAKLRGKTNESREGVVMSQPIPGRQSYIVLDLALVDQIDAMTGAYTDEVEDDYIVAWSHNPNTTAKLSAFAKKNPTRLKISNWMSARPGDATWMGRWPSDNIDLKEQGMAEANFPGAPDVTMPPMKFTSPEKAKLTKEYNKLHSEKRGLLDRAYGGDKQAKARIAQIDARIKVLKSELAKLGVATEGVAEGDIPSSSGIDTYGASLGTGRSQTTLEGKKDFAAKFQKNIDKSNKDKKETEEKVKTHQKDDKKKVEEASKPDFIDLDKDGNKKESMKKASHDIKKQKKKVNESMHKHSAAKLLGKSHALAKEGYNCKYDDMDEARMYHEGYKEGLDECYGQEPIVGLMKETDMIPATIPGMDDQEMGLDEMDVVEMDKSEWMQHKARTTPGDTFKAFGQTMHDRDVLDDSVFESWDRELSSLLTEYEGISEGMSVSISKGQQGSPDSVSVTAQDGEADQLLNLIKQSGLGLFGGDDSQSGISVPSDGEMVSSQGGIEVVDDHDGMMGLIKKLAGKEQSSSDYEEEGSSDEHDHGHDHDHNDSEEETCNECGYMESKCECEKEQIDDAAQRCPDCGEEGEQRGHMGCQYPSDTRSDLDEVESEDQMAYEVAEANSPDSDEAETTADEDAEAQEDQALARADELNEWANQTGKGPGKGTDASFEQDIEFMTKMISGGLNKPKSTGQTTIPVIAGQDTRMEDPAAWAKLAGIKK